MCVAFFLSMKKKYQVNILKFIYFNSFNFCWVFFLLDVLGSHSYHQRCRFGVAVGVKLRLWRNLLHFKAKLHLLQGQRQARVQRVRGHGWADRGNTQGAGAVRLKSDWSPLCGFSLFSNSRLNTMGPAVIFMLLLPKSAQLVHSHSAHTLVDFPSFPCWIFLTQIHYNQMQLRLSSCVRSTAADSFM